MKAANPSITILVDNHAGDGLMAEHGFSLWIEIGNERILFDTGQKAALAHNAQRLGIDLEQTDHLVLSHGHYDHTGGIDHVLKRPAHPHVYCHPGAVQPRYSIRNGTPRQIQMPRAGIAAIDHLSNDRLHWVSRPLEVSEHIALSGPIPRTTAYEDSGGPFYLDPDGRRVDPVDDDLALWVRTGEDLIVCVGCCHAGIVNTLHHILQLNPGRKIRAVIGGLHLLEADTIRMEKTVAALKRLPLERVIPCHCTGDPAIATLQHALGPHVSPGVAGGSYRF